MAGGNHSKEHTALVKSTCKELTIRFKDARAFQRNVGADTNTWHLYGTPGEGDIMVLLAPRGRVLYLEAKTGKARQNVNQKNFQAYVSKLGVQYHVFRSVEEAVRILENAER